MSGLITTEKHFSKTCADEYTGSLSPNTKRAYITGVKDFFGVSELTDITLEMIQSVNLSSAEQYRESLREKGYKPATVNQRLTCLSSFYSYLSRHEVGIVPYNPFSGREGLARVKYNSKYSNTRCLTKKEVQKLVRLTMEGNDIEALRNRIIVLLLATTGMRRSELISIKIGDIKSTQSQDVIEIVGKGDKERFVVISGTIKVFIDNYIKMRGLSYDDGEAYLLVSHSKNVAGRRGHSISDKAVYNVIKKLADRAGIDSGSISPHCLRHTYITEALDMGVNIEDVQDMVGHTSIGTTRRYDHTNRILKNNPAESLTAMFLDDEESKA